MSSPYGEVAVCQEWVMTWSGSEQVSKRLAEVLGAKHVYTYAGRPELLKKAFGNRPVTTSRLGRSHFAQRRWHLLLPFMARWWRSLDLSGFDLVVTCSHAAVNDVRAPKNGVHVSYCCTPMRYAWGWRSELGRIPSFLRPVWPLIAALLRRADRRRAQKVDVFLAVSQHVADRIERAYSRTSTVVYPPVDTAYFTPRPDIEREDFFLYAGRLVAYKRPDIAVRAARSAGVPLVVAGSGPELERLRSLAGPDTVFAIDPTDEDLRDLYRRTRALVFPGIEDFGMVLVEAQACGAPVLAYGKGGAREAVRHGTTGIIFDDGSAEGLARELARFDPSRFDELAIRQHAEGFGKQRFDDAIEAVVGGQVGSRLTR